MEQDRKRGTMDQGWVDVSFRPDASSAPTTAPSSVASDGPWDKHCKKPKLENGSGLWGQLDIGSGPWQQVERPQVDKGRGQSLLREMPQVAMCWGQGPKVERPPVDKGWGQWPQVDKRWRQGPQVENGCGRQPQRRLSSPLYSSDDQVQDAVLTLQEMKNSSPTNCGTFRQVDKGWGQWKHTDKGLGQQRPQIPPPSPVNARDDPVEIIDDELTLEEMKKKSPKNSETLSNDSQLVRTIKATENTNMITEKVISIKLMIDSKAKRVLFAEAEKEFIDFLFGLLALPVASIVELITKTNMAGSMGNLYESVENISASYFLPNLDKNSILKPRVVLPAGKIPLLPPSVRSTGAKYYRCAASSHHSFITKSPKTRCPNCSSQMNTEMTYIAEGTSDASLADVGYVKGGLVKYLVMDELMVMPMSTIPSISLLKKFNVVDVSSLEDKIVEFGMKEGLDVLKAALQSKNILTEVFLGKKTNPEICNDLQPLRTIMVKENTNTAREKVLSIKVLVDTKAKRVLFAEAEKEFVDFLFSILVLPVASIIEVIAKKKMAGSMANLYDSVENISPTYFQPNLDKNSILKPREILSAGKIYLQPPTVEATGGKYYMCSTSFHHSYVTKLPGTKCPSCPTGNFQMRTEMSYVVDETSEGSSMDTGYVKGGMLTYLVTDELEVMPMSAISSINLLKKFKIADVSVLEEKTFDFGIREAMEVLIAALQSKAVLTEVFLGQEPKSETQ